jgi:hypothetical protein
MNLWMVKQETNGFPNMDTVMKRGVMFKSDFLTTNTDTATHFFPISRHHFWQVPLYFFSSLRRITYACDVSLSFGQVP